MAKIRMELNNGKHMDIEIFEDKAPISAENFLKYVDDGFFDGTIFHRVIPNFMIQGGGFIDDGDGLREKKATYPAIQGEFASNGIKNDVKHQPGVLSMARTMFKNSATSQFFICVDDCAYLDGEYAAFGKVTSGMEVVDAIAATKTGRNDRPVEDQKIASITVNTYGVEFPEPKKLPDPYGRF